MARLPLRLAFAIAAPLLLLGCFLTPGKFVSTLSVNADRSFAFTYKGEVYARDGDTAAALGKTASGGDDQQDDDDATQAAFILTAQPKGGEGGESAAEKVEKKAAADARNRAIAAALARESGYRSVQYVGDGKFLIDYAISGTLDHSFIYPFNTDAEIVFPFIAIELRGKDMVRVKAPAFANDKDMPGGDGAASKLDGSFTLDTDAEIVSQNNEDGATTANGRKMIVWRATPLTREAPTASLRVAPLK